MNKGKHKQHCIEMVKILLPNIQNINAKNGFRLTALHEAIFNLRNSPCMAEILKLIAPLCDMNVTDGNGDSALDMARQFNVLDVIRPSKKRKYK